MMFCPQWSLTFNVRCLASANLDQPYLDFHLVRNTPQPVLVAGYRHRWYRFASGCMVLRSLEAHRTIFLLRSHVFTPISVWAGLGWYKLDSLHPEGLCCRSGFPELVGYRILYSYNSLDNWDPEPDPSRLRGWVHYHEAYAAELPAFNPAHFRRHLRG